MTMLRRFVFMLIALFVATGCDYYIAPHHGGTQAAHSPSARSSAAPPALPTVPQDTGPGRAVVERGHRLGFTPTAGPAGQVQVSNTNGEPYSDSHLTYSTSGTGAFNVGADTTGYLTIGGGTLPTSGLIRVPAAQTILESENHAGSGSYNILATDTNNEVYVGDTNGNVAYTQVGAYTAVVLNASFYGGIAEWGGIAGKPGWLQSQLSAANEPTSGNATYGQWWFDTQSRPKYIDAQSNKAWMGQTVEVLNANFTTTSSTASALSPVFHAAANDVVRVKWWLTTTDSAAGGLGLEIIAPTGATVEGQIVGQNAGYTSGRISAPNTIYSAYSNSLTGVAVYGWATVFVSTTPGDVKVAINSVNNTDTITVFKGSSIDLSVAARL